VGGPNCAPAGSRFPLPSNISAEGSKKFERFRMLKNSARNCSFILSWSKPQVLAREGSKSTRPGPRRLFRPKFPSCCQRFRRHNQNGQARVPSGRQAFPVENRTTHFSMRGRRSGLEKPLTTSKLIDERSFDVAYWNYNKVVSFIMQTRPKFPDCLQFFAFSCSSNSASGSACFSRISRKRSSITRLRASISRRISLQAIAKRRMSRFSGRCSFLKSSSPSETSRSPRSVSEIYGLKRLRATNDHDGSDLQLFS
jgi:hypothetical protein